MRHKPNWGPMIAEGVAVIGLLIAPWNLAHTLEADTKNTKPAIEDWRLQDEARDRLRGDEKLARYNLGVTVKEGVATLWGTVPQETLAKHAKQITAEIPGIVQIKQEVRIVAAEDPLPKQLAAALKQPQQVVKQPPVVDKTPATPSFMPLPVKAPEPQPTTVVAAKNPPTLQQQTVSRRISLESSSASVTLLQPIVSADPKELEDKLETIRKNDLRYRKLNLQANDGVIRITGYADRMADIWDLADQLSQINGITKVVVGKVEVK